MDVLDQPVGSVMSGPLKTVARSASLEEVDRLLAEHEISGVVVTGAQDAPVGVISRTDLLRAGAGRARRIQVSVGLSAADVMHPDPVCVDQKDSIREAARAMARNSVHRVMVVDGTQPVGLLSVTDLMGAVADSPITTPLSELASEGIASLSASTTVGTATARLRAAGVRAMLVLQDGGPAGVFTQAEALTASCAADDDPVAQWMRPTVCQLPEQTPLNAAAREAIAHGAPLIVVTRDGEPRGVISPSDMLYAAL